MPNLIIHCCTSIGNEKRIFTQLGYVWIKFILALRKEVVAVMFIL